LFFSLQTNAHTSTNISNPEVIVSLSNSTTTKTTTIKYFSNTTTGLDAGWDAGAFDGASSSFSINTHLVNTSSTNDFTLQCLPNFDYEKSVVPLSIKSAATEITFSTITQNLPTDINVYLEDRTTKTVHKINDGGTHTLILDSSIEGIGRFYLHTTSTEPTIYYSDEDHLVSGDLSVNSNESLILESDASQSSSLIVTGTTTGNIRYKRNVNDTNWHLIASPVTTQNINNFVSDLINRINKNGDKYAIAYYDNTKAVGSRWVYYTESDVVAAGDFSSGKGYTINRTIAGDFIFDGEMNNADLNVPLTTTSNHFWYCIGNPYPSFLPANNGANSSSNLLTVNASALDPSFQALYFWNGSSYEAINHANDGIQIHPGQAFMIKAKSNNEVFAFLKNLQNDGTGAATFFRNEVKPSIKIKLSKGSSTASTELKYISIATAGLDPGYDAGTFEEIASNFSINTHLVANNEGVNFTKQCLPNTNLEETVVPLSVKVTAGSEIIFSAEATNLPENINVYLEDRLTNTFEKINENDYNITLDTNINGIGRFYLHTKSSVLTINDTSLANFNIYKTNNNTIRILGLGDKNMTFAMYSVLGKQILKTTLKEQKVNEISLPDNIKTGLYLIELVNSEKRVTKKIMI